MKGGERMAEKTQNNIQRTLEIEKNGTRFSVEIHMSNASEQMEQRVHEWLTKLYEEIQQDI